MKKLLLSVALVAVAAGTAQAADPIVFVDEPVVEIDNFHDWTGFYVGVFGGFGSGTATANPELLADDTEVPISGGLAGVSVGVLGQWDMFVLGAEGNLAWTNIGGDNTEVCVGAVPVANCDADLGWLGSAELQAGIAIDKVLLTVHGGFATGELTAGSDFVDPLLDASHSTHASGYVVGVGAAVAVTEEISIEGKYSYYNLSHTYEAGEIAPAAAGKVDVNAAFHTFTVGANFHF